LLGRNIYVNRFLIAKANRFSCSHVVFSSGWLTFLWHTFRYNMEIKFSLLVHCPLWHTWLAAGAAGTIWAYAFASLVILHSGPVFMDFAAQWRRKAPFVIRKHGNIGCRVFQRRNWKWKVLITKVHIQLRPRLYVVLYVRFSSKTRIIGMLLPSMR
jgi:hypothetical protein